MKRKKITAGWLACVGIALLGSEGWAQENSRIDLKLQYWRASVDGKIEADEYPVNGNRRSLNSDLGLNEFAYTPYAELIWRGEGEHANFFRLSFFDARHQEHQTLDSPTLFNGHTFGIGEDVETLVHTRVFGADLGGTTKLSEKVDGTFFIGARYLDVETDLRAPTHATDERTRLLTGGAGVHVDVRPATYLTVTGGMGAYYGNGTIEDEIAIDFERYSVWTVESFAAATLQYKSFGIDLGFRTHWINFDIGRESSDAEEHNNNWLRYAGPTLGVTITF